MAAPSLARLPGGASRVPARRTKAGERPQHLQLQPIEWVAVGRCGHRDICAGCATRIRFFRHDRRCCICRAHCSTVLVTRADGGASGSSRQQGFVLPARLPPIAAPGRKGSRAGSYWYHGVTGAYFGARRPYRAAVKLCVKPPPPRPASQGAVATFACIYLGVIMLLVVMFELFFEVADNYYKKVTIVLAFGLLSAVVTVSTISAWHRYKNILILNRDA
ncbi:hypothetical protein PVAP13_6NG123112 [Panicum virgatum]|uniref:Uncharacterized protein n=1 Tax=Panicum virgatum TaxID=38727 RepID=A0A8T0R0A1_PANVG|nr:hypothetical protein PVAP13_6NG123112 [Panicum virgatum]